MPSALLSSCLILAPLASRVCLLTTIIPAGQQNKNSQHPEHPSSLSTVNLSAFGQKQTSAPCPPFPLSPISFFTSASAEQVYVVLQAEEQRLRSKPQVGRGAIHGKFKFKFKFKRAGWLLL